MSRPLDVAVLVGSLRKDSINRKLALQLAKLAGPDLKLDFVEIGDLPLYNPDDEASPPKAWTTFRDAIRKADAILFVTPEYNRSVPAALKNALDVGSRPMGQSVWNGKPTAILSSSPGALGGFGANHHLRQSLVFLNAPAMAQPEMYLSHADKLLNADGEVTDEGTRAFLKRFLDAFTVWIDHNKPG